MAGSLGIRWTSAARIGGLGTAVAGALFVLAGALEPAPAAPLPPDVGLGPSAAAPAAPSPAGAARDFGTRTLPDARSHDRAGRERASRQRPPRHREAKREHAEAPVHLPMPQPPARRAAGAPSPVSIAPAPPVQTSSPAPPAAPPGRPEFGFER